MKFMLKQYYKSAKRPFTEVISRLKNADKDQVKLLQEELIQVDLLDNQIGKINKLDAHLKESNKYPHRAFSLFIFNSKGETLLQQRSQVKITFPGLWSNACCSHPLATMEEEEPEIGNKRAVIRRTKIELNIDLKIENLMLVDRLIYRASSDSLFEEYEGII